MNENFSIEFVFNKPKNSIFELIFTSIFFLYLTNFDKLLKNYSYGSGLCTYRTFTVKPSKQNKLTVCLGVNFRNFKSGWVVNHHN